MDPQQPCSGRSIKRPFPAFVGPLDVLEVQFSGWGSLLLYPVGFHSRLILKLAGHGGGTPRWHAANPAEARRMPSIGLAGSCVILLGLLGSCDSSICHSPSIWIGMEVYGRSSCLVAVGTGIAVCLGAPMGGAYGQHQVCGARVCTRRSQKNYLKRVCLTTRLQLLVPQAGMGKTRWAV